MARVTGLLRSQMLNLGTGMRDDCSKGPCKLHRKHTTLRSRNSQGDFHHAVCFLHLQNMVELLNHGKHRPGHHETCRRQTRGGALSRGMAQTKGGGGGGLDLFWSKPTSGGRGIECARSLPSPHPKSLPRPKELDISAA